MVSAVLAGEPAVAVKDVGLDEMLKSGMGTVTETVVVLENVVEFLPETVRL